MKNVFVFVEVALDYDRVCFLSCKRTRWRTGDAACTNVTGPQGDIHAVL